MEAIQIARTSAKLYNAVLRDTPLAQFFECFIYEPVRDWLWGVYFQIILLMFQDVDETNMETIRNIFYKSKFESFITSMSVSSSFITLWLNASCLTLSSKTCFIS